jgi:predicted TIM-barrel fold metal-dependent hydrolase
MKATDCNTIFGHLPDQGLQATAAELAEVCAMHNIEAALSISATGVYHDFAIGNRETLEAAAAHPMLKPVATFDPRRLYGGLTELDEILQQPFCAVRLFPCTQGWPLTSEAFLEAMKRIVARDVPVMIECCLPGIASHLRTMRELSNVPVILMNVGRETFSEVVALAESGHHFFVDTSALYQVGAIDLLAEKAGLENLVFGSNAPAISPRCAMESLRHSRIGDDGMRMVLAENLRRAVRI